MDILLSRYTLHNKYESNGISTYIELIPIKYTIPKIDIVCLEKQKTLFV